MALLGGVTRNMHPLIDLYQNYGAKDDTVVSNELVCKIFSNISFIPARTSAYIAKSLNIDPKTVEWHLRKLNDANIIAQNGEKNKYWIRGIIDEEEIKYFDALSFSASRLIMSKVMEEKEVELGELNLNKVTAGLKIKILENIGFLNENRKGKEVYLTLNEEYIRFRNLVKGRSNIFITNYLRRLKLAKITFEILNVTNYSLVFVSNYGIPIILSRDPLYTVIKYG